MAVVQATAAASIQPLARELPYAADAAVKKKKKKRYKWAYLRSKNKLLDKNRLVIAKEEEVGGGMDCEFGISRSKVLYIEEINDKVNILGKNILKKSVYVYTHI